MLMECVEVCPEDLWTAGEISREYWRISMHAAFFTQFFLAQDWGSYSPWPGRPVGLHEEMWLDPASTEPYELAIDTPPFSREVVLDYIEFVAEQVDPTIDGLDLNSPESGFPWYSNMSKLSHELMNLRHLQGHVGQLSELLLSRGIETTWVGKGSLTEWKHWEIEND
jgi:hypothetical protein